MKGIRRRDEQDFGQIERDVKIVIHKTVVLFGV